MQHTALNEDSYKLYSSPSFFFFLMFYSTLSSTSLSISSSSSARRDDSESGFSEVFFFLFLVLFVLLLLCCLQMWSPNESNIIQHLDSFICQPTLPALISVRPLCTLVHDPPWQFSIGCIAVWDAAMSVLHTELFSENRYKLDVVFLDLRSIIETVNKNRN